MKPVVMCKKCVLPEVRPHIALDANGICNLCRDYEKQQKEEASAGKLLESDFIKILDKHRGKGRYDCLVMCSGGKDSTAALYFMKTRYKMNPLAFMFDHGFETGEAIQNVRTAAEKLGVDFMLYRTDEVKALFRELIRSKSKAVICHPCSIWYMQLGFDMAARIGAGIIIAGWTKGQSTKQEVMSSCGCNVHAPEYREMSDETVKFLDGTIQKLPQFKDFPRSMDEMLKRAKKKTKAMVYSPHWFLPYTADEYVEIIQKEVGWKYPEVSYPRKSTNCMMNFVSVHNSMRDYGYTHYHVEMSKLIREGLMTREDALKNLSTDFSDQLLGEILAKLGLTVEDIR